MQLKCYYDKTIQRDVKSGDTIFAVNPKERIDGMNQYGQIICHGIIPEYRHGFPLLISGEITDNNIIEITSFMEHASSSEDVLSFFRCGYISGIGDKTAAQIGAALGFKLFKWPQIKGIAERLQGFRGITKDKAVELIQMIDSFERFRKFLQYTLSVDGFYLAASKYFMANGTDSEARIKKDPYKAMAYGYSFASCEKIANHCHVNRLGIDRLSALAKKAIEMIESTGSTCATLKEFISTYLKIEKSITEGPMTDPFYVMAAVFEQKELFTAIMQEDELMIFSTETYLKERKIAERIIWLNETKHCAPGASVSIKALEEDLGIQYSEEQKAAFLLLDSPGVKVLTGGPGTGKTTVLNGLIRYYESRFPNKAVSLCAPTANAARRMRESTGKNAFTVHKFLGLRPLSGGGLMSTGKTDIPAGLLIIDEASMLDIELFHMIMENVQAGTVLLLVGDEGQLESVGVGNVLGDLLALVPSCRLTKVFRQDEGSNIVYNSVLMNMGDTALREGKDVKIVRVGTEEMISKAVMDYYMTYKDNKDPWKLRILTPVRMKKYNYSTMALNQNIQKLVNHNEEAVIYGGKRFSVGDPVQFTKNNYDAGYINGDTGIIVSIEAEGRVLHVKLDNKTIRVSEKILADLDLAYATTIHKSQGGECETSIIIVPQNPPGMLNRKIAYVASTRAKTMNIVISEKDALEKAIKNTNYRKRRTGLKGLLKEFI